MKRAEEYRKHAQECRVLASSAMSDKERDQLLALAQTWEKLAVERETFMQRHPELSAQIEKARAEEQVKT